MQLGAGWWNRAKDQIGKPIAGQIARLDDAGDVCDRDGRRRLEAGRTVPENDHEPNLFLMDHEVRVGVIVDVVGHDGRKRRRRADGRRRLERAVAVAVQDHHERTSVARERQVDVAVAVEIGRHYVLRFGRQRDDGRSAELPEAVAE